MLLFFFRFGIFIITVSIILSARKIKEHWENVVDRACLSVITAYFLNSLAFYSKSAVTPCMTQRLRASEKVRIAQTSAFIRSPEQMQWSAGPASLRLALG